MKTLLAPNTKARTAAVTAAGFLLTLIFTQVLLPGAPGGGRGTPGAMLFLGLVMGLVNALTAVALVLVYRTVRVINFAQTALGVIGARLFFDVVQFTRIPFVIALLSGLVVAAAAGVLFDLFLRRFQEASRLIVTVFTIAAATLLAAIGPQIVREIPLVPDDASFASAIGGEQLRPRLPFAGFEFTIGGLNYPFGFPEVFALETVVFALIVVGAIFKFTKLGVAMRAMAGNVERASLLGISVGSVTMGAFVIASILSALSAMLTGAIQTPGAAGGIAPGVLLPALAAAVIARFDRIPTAIIAAVLIRIASQAFVYSFDQHARLVDVAIFLIIGVGLLFQRKRLGRSEAAGGVSWQTVDEPRPIPKELSGVGTVRLTRWAIIALGVILVIAYPFFAGTGNTVLGSGIALSAIVTLSIVVLTGWSGQVSLGQFGFYAIGAVVGGSLSSKVGIPGGFWVAVPLAALITGGFAFLIGIPALRIKGLFLAVTTLAFAFAVSGALFEESYFGWLLPTDVERPTLFLLDFEDPQSMYFLCVAAFALCAVLVTNMRKSRFGRVLIAARENEANIQSFGISLIRTKLMAFAVAGGLCGFAGAIFAHLQFGVSSEAFAAQASVDLFVNSVLGGVSSVGGAVIGSALFQLQNNFFQGNAIYQALSPALAMLALFFAPGGIIGLINRIRDAALRIVAQRRQIVVPSLFADYDPDALERRLIQLGAPSTVGGLNALPAGERFALPSELYEGTGVRITEKLAPAKQSKEAAAIGAAAEAAQERPEIPADIATSGSSR